MWRIKPNKADNDNPAYRLMGISYCSEEDDAIFLQLWGIEKETLVSRDIVHN